MLLRQREDSVDIAYLSITFSEIFGWGWMFGGGEYGVRLRLFCDINEKANSMKRTKNPLCNIIYTFSKNFIEELIR